MKVFAQVGRLEIRPGFEYEKNKSIHTSIEIDWARFFSFRALTDFWDEIAQHVTSGNRKSADYMTARLSIQSALTAVLWNNYHVSPYDKRIDADSDWGDLELGFNGTADYYFVRRNAPAWRERAAAAAYAQARW